MKIPDIWSARTTPPKFRETGKGVLVRGPTPDQQCVILDGLSTFLQTKPEGHRPAYTQPYIDSAGRPASFNTKLAIPSWQHQAGDTPPANALGQSVASSAIWRTRRSAILLLALAILGLGGALLAFRQGMIPARLSLLPVVDLAQPDAWLLDWRLAELKGERDLCARVLKPPYIEAQPIPDQPIVEGCGWTAAVRIAALSGARLATDKLSCQSAAGLALWVAHDVQPLALALLGQRVTSIRHMGTYSCRNVVGSPLFKGWRSAHATANAIDIAGFTLADGRTISVQTHWKTTSRDGEFLRAIHTRACRYFHVAIGPDYNAAHHDHFHFDRGIGSVCR